jgi:methionyl-tRNA formyltransferase
MASFNQIVNAPTLRIPHHGFINIHPSRLPDYRGPEPVYWVIADGAEVTGISLHRAVPKVDAGPILAQAEIAVDPGDTSGTLTRRLVGAGLPLLGTAVTALLENAPGTQPDLHAGSYRPSVGHRRLDEAPSAEAAVYVLAAQLRAARAPGPDRAPLISFPDGDLALLSVSPNCHCHHDVEDCPHREDARAR